MRFSITALLRQPHDAKHSLPLVRNSYNEESFDSPKRDFDTYNDECNAKSTVRPLVRNKLGRIGGHAGSSGTENGLGQDVIQGKDSKSKREYIWGKVVDNFSKARAAVAAPKTKDFFPKNEPHHEVHAPVIGTDTLNNT